MELHLRLMRLIQVSKCSWKVISVIWDLVVSPIVLPEAKGMLFTWLSEHFPLLDKEARVKLSGILTFCSDSLKDVIVSTELPWETILSQDSYLSLIAMNHTIHGFLTIEKT